MVQKWDGATLYRSNSDILMEQGMFVGCFGSEYDLSQVVASNKTAFKNDVKSVGMIVPHSSSMPEKNEGKRKISRSYVRPVFKEPASKISYSKPPSTSDVNSRQLPDDFYRTPKSNQQRRQDPPTGRETCIRNEPLLEDVSFAHGDVIQPSPNTTDRLNHLLGRPIGGQGTKKLPPCHTTHMPFGGSVGLDQRRLRPADFGPTSLSQRRKCSSGRVSTAHDVGDDQTECGGSVATVSDLDYLASKSLRRKKPAHLLGQRQVSMLRKEIKEMVVCLEEAPEVKQEQKNSPTQLSCENQEGFKQQCQQGSDAIRSGIESFILWCQDGSICRTGIVRTT
ncbi:hypothetical protein IV203_035924 [Nitzschia inconspicua]|uniref:Uncharacterized protein n=1 Tax=Nitzschia inconspicua TaxID=303405 RepID=A0A9K3LF93_9STRA|nr:hypothetical protein IV203_035924 [Nitzschia inconspicua]